MQARQRGCVAMNILHQQHPIHADSKVTRHRQAHSHLPKSMSSRIAEKRPSSPRQICNTTHRKGSGKARSGAADSRSAAAKTPARLAREPAPYDASRDAYAVALVSLHGYHRARGMGARIGVQALQPCPGHHNGHVPPTRPPLLPRSRALSTQSIWGKGAGDAPLRLLRPLFTSRPLRRVREGSARVSTARRPPPGP